MTQYVPLQDRLDRAIDKVIPEDKKLSSLVKTRHYRAIKMGFDPTKPDLHLGHLVGLRKLAQLAKLGHNIVIIVGDYTARIGDPSGRDVTRPPMTQPQVTENAETYLNQVSKILDTAEFNIKIEWQSDWYDHMRLEDFLDITQRISATQLLHRNDFRNRLTEQKPITLTELLYPVLQAYDSLEVSADMEFGGTDQLFNLMLGRTLQQAAYNKEWFPSEYYPQDCVTVPLLPGLDGKKKMSKSYDNYIAFTDTSYDMFRKTMQIDDDNMIIWYELLTDIHPPENLSPVDTKKHLAKNIVSQFYNYDEAIRAEQRFKNEVQNRSTVTPEYKVSIQEIAEKGLIQVLVDTKIADSKSKAKRLPITKHGSSDTFDPATAKPGDIIKIGKHTAIELT